MECSDISAVIVTKGDQDLSAVLASLPFDDVVIHDNSKEPEDRKVYGRFLGIRRAKNHYIYVQDDDCIVPAKELANRYVEGRTEILCNVTKSHSDFYRPLGCTLVGWGAIFPRVAVGCFTRYLKQFPEDELFDRECDRIFTALNRFREVDLGVQHLPHALGRDRMGTEARHGRDLHEIRGRLAMVKKAA